MGQVHSLKSPGMWEECFHRRENPESFANSTCESETWALRGDGIGLPFCLNLAPGNFCLHTSGFSLGNQAGLHIFPPSGQYLLPPLLPTPPARYFHRVAAFSVQGPVSIHSCHSDQDHRT